MGILKLFRFALTYWISPRTVPDVVYHVLLVTTLFLGLTLALGGGEPGIGDSSGELRLVEPFSPRLTLLSPRRPAAAFRAAIEGFDWWLPNLATLGGWLRAAGFVDERRVAIARPPGHPAMRQWQAAYAARTPANFFFADTSILSTTASE